MVNNKLSRACLVEKEFINKCPCCNEMVCEDVHQLLFHCKKWDTFRNQSFGAMIDETCSSNAAYSFGRKDSSEALHNHWKEPHSWYNNYTVPKMLSVFLMNEPIWYGILKKPFPNQALAES